MLLKIEFLKIHFGHIINLKMIIDPIPKRVFGKSTLVGIHTRLGIQNRLRHGQGSNNPTIVLDS